jgi:hypothetical protein
MINRSINFNEITPIWAECPSQYCDFIKSIIQIKDCDNARENDGSRDVWGTFHKENFRLRIFKA